MTEKELMKEIGRNIEYCLEDARMSQKELAEEIGVTDAIISYYIKGERMPSLKNIINISYALCCSIDELIGGFNDELII